MRSSATRGLVTLMVLALAAALGVSAAYAQALPTQLLDRLRAATVFIAIYDPQTSRERASGTGFFVSPNGDVATCRHLAVIPGQRRIVINSGQPTERTVEAQVMKLDPYSDQALLKVDQKNTPYLRLGDSDRLRETDRVITVGFPLGSELKTSRLGPSPSFRVALVSSLRRSLFGGVRMIELGNALARGSSGSPLVDERGTVVGIVTQAGPAEAFALPSRPLIRFARDRVSLADEDATVLEPWLADPVEEVQFLAEMGRLPEAHDKLAGLMRRDPDSLRLRVLYVGVEEGLGNRDAAVSGYQQLIRDYPSDPRAFAWSNRVEELAETRGDGVVGNNLAVASAGRGEVTVVDAGANRMLAIVPNLQSASPLLLLPGQPYAYGRDETQVFAVDLNIPQDAPHLRRRIPELGTTDWLSASRDGSVVAVGISWSLDGEAPSESTVVVYRNPRLQEVARYTVPGFVHQGFVTPDGETALLFTITPETARNVAPAIVNGELVLRPGSQIQQLDLANGKVSLFAPAAEMTPKLAFAGEAPFAYSVMPDSSVVRLDPRNRRITPIPVQNVSVVAAAPEPGQVLFGGEQLTVWDAERNQLVKRYPLPFEAGSIGATPDGTFLYATDARGTQVALINRATGKVNTIKFSGAPEQPHAEQHGIPRGIARDNPDGAQRGSTRRSNRR